MSIISGIKNLISGRREPTIDEVDVPGIMTGPDMNSFVQQPGFSEAFYRHQELNIAVDSSKSFLDRVESSHLSRRCKNAWSDIIKNYYDRNVLLSDLSGRAGKDVEIAYLRMRIDTICAIRVNSYKSDRINPEFAKIEMLFLAQMWHRFMRCRGPDRERIVGTKLQFSYDSKQKLTKESRPQ